MIGTTRLSIASGYFAIAKRDETGHSSAAAAAEPRPSPGLVLQRALIRNHLARDDIRVERQRAVPGGLDLDMVTSCSDAERLRVRRELSDGAERPAIDEDLGRRRIDVE